MSLRRPAAKLLGGIAAAAMPVAVYRYSQVQERERQLPSEQLDVFSESKMKKDGGNDKKKLQQQQQQRQRVIILGGGVVGVTAAYKMAQSGKQVVVLEPRPKPGKECSACAAGGMQRSNVVVDRNTWMAVLQCVFPLPTWLGGTKDKFRFFHFSFPETVTDPFFLRWLLTFTRTSFFPDEHQNDKQQEMLKFTKYGVDLMVDMMEDPKDNMAAQSGFNTRGSVNVSYDPVVAVADDDDDDAKGDDNAPSHSINTYEPHLKIVGQEALFQREPSLRWEKQPPTRAIYEYEAKSASSERFTLELARRCVEDPNLDVTFLYDTAVRGIEVKQPETTAVAATTTTTTTKKPIISELKTNRGVIAVPEDAKVVIAAGAWTPHIMALMDVYAPVYPLKGYAMSVSAKEALAANPKLQEQDLPSRIVADKYLYTTRLGDEIRITSIGEFSGWSTAPKPDADAEFRREAVVRMPQLEGLIQQAQTRCGHRPYVSDGILLLGEVDTHQNLFVSVGPGSNGWKLAVGSADMIDRLVSGQSYEDIAKELGFDASALAPAGRVIKAPFFAKLCRARWNI